MCPSGAVVDVYFRDGDREVTDTNVNSGYLNHGEKRCESAKAATVVYL